MSFTDYFFSYKNDVTFKTWAFFSLKFAESVLVGEFISSNKFLRSLSFIINSSSLK